MIKTHLDQAKDNSQKIARDLRKLEELQVNVRVELPRLLLASSAEEDKARKIQSAHINKKWI